MPRGAMQGATGLRDGSIWAILFIAAAILTVHGVNAQNSTDASNAVCTKAGWKAVPYFGTAVSSADFQPQDLSANSPYYRGPVERRAIPTGILVALAIVLLLIFVLWQVLWCCCICCCRCRRMTPRRVLRCCCICCCRCCCVKPTPYPEEVLGTARQLIIKLIIALLALGVCACCAYGMSQIDTQLVSHGLSVINSMKDYMETVLGTADSIVNGVDGVNGLLDTAQEVLDVDVNITDISTGITCIAPFIQDLQPGVALGYLLDVQYQISSILTPDIAFLSGNFSDLVSTEAPALSTNAAVILTAPAFLSSYATETSNFITAVNNLPATFPGQGHNDPTVSALGSSLGAYGLPLNGGASSKTGQLSSFVSAFSAIYSAKPGDLTTLTDIQNSLDALGTAGINLTATLPLLSAYLLAASSNYSHTRPCMADLLARMLHINTTVIVFPASLESATIELQSVEATLDAVLYNGTTNATALADQISSVTPSISTTPFQSSTLTALANAQSQLTSITDPNAANGTNTYFNQLSSDTAAASGSVSTCNTDYTSFMGTNSLTDYNTMVSDCQAAVSALGPANTLLGNSNGASSAASSLSALQTALGNLPSQQTVTTSLTSVQSSLNAVPNLAAYIQALTSAVTAYNALGPTLFTDVQSQITSINSSITSSIASARSQVSSTLGPVQSQVNMLHNQTVDRITGYQKQYQPTVQHYDQIRQIVEYLYFALAMGVCIGLIIAVATNCPFLTGFLTLILLVLTVIYGIVAVVLFIVASIGNDGCANMESFIVGEIPCLTGNDPDTAHKAATLANYYLYNQGGPVSAILHDVAGVNLTQVFAQVNSTRDQAVATITGSYTLQPKLQAVVNGFVNLSNTAVANITAAEDLATYQNIHPLYLEVKAFVCCSGVNMLGNLWAAMFAAGSLSIILLLFMFVYIRDLDRLPEKGCCGCAPRSAKEFEDLRKPSARYTRDLQMAERLRSGTSIGGFGREEGSMRGPLGVQGSGGSRGSLLAPHSAKQGRFKQVEAAYPVHASAPSNLQPPPPQIRQRQQYMQHALQMDSASY